MEDHTKPKESPKYRVIGTRPIRHDGVDKFTGRAKYGADYAFRRMIHGKVLRSPHAHARIKSINVEQALQLPGVFAIVTGADLPEIASKTEDLGEGAVNSRYVSTNVLARDKVLYDGHAVAAVAAVNGHVADEALKLIQVEYEVLPSAMTVDAAMKPNAPVLLPELPNKEEGPAKETNVANQLKFTRGNLSEGFAAADFIVEREFNTAMVHQGYIEPHNAVGMYSSDGHATIYCSTQGTFAVRSLTSQVLQMPEGNIKVVPAEIGGGFGGKLGVYLEPLAVLLSKKTGRPVKMVVANPAHPLGIRGVGEVSIVFPLAAVANAWHRSPCQRGSTAASPAAGGSGSFRFGPIAQRTLRLSAAGSLAVAGGRLPANRYLTERMASARRCGNR
jgi:xanthine dehydrogenase molybdenum-binding subunit